MEPDGGGGVHASPGIDYGFHMARDRDFGLLLQQSALVTADNGDLSRPLGAGAWNIPHVELCDGSLLWEFADIEPVASDLRRRWAVAPRDLLERFLSLHRSPAEAIHAFAEDFGPLLHDPDVRPGHGDNCRTCAQALGESVRTGVPNAAMLPGHGSEPVRLWLELAADARATLRCAALLDRGSEPTEKDWSEFGNFEIDEDQPGGVLLSVIDSGTRLTPFGLDSGSFEPELILSEFVSSWLRFARPEIRFLWSAKQRPMLQLEPGGVLGAIGLQLAQALARTDGLSLCDGCGTGYTPRRESRAGQRRFCNTCRANRVPQLAAERDYRKRRRERDALC